MPRVSMPVTSRQIADIDESSTFVMSVQAGSYSTPSPEAPQDFSSGGGGDFSGGGATDSF